MSLEMSQQRELATGAREATSDPATTRQEGLHRFRWPVGQQKAELVEWHPLTTRCLVSKRQQPQESEVAGRATRSISQSTPPARRGHEARNQRQRADVDQKPLETRPHNVSGARRVAAPVPRTGEQAHGLKTTSHPTRSLWRREEL